MTFWIVVGENALFFEMLNFSFWITRDPERLHRGLYFVVKGPRDFESISFEYDGDDGYPLTEK